MIILFFRFFKFFFTVFYIFYNSTTHVALVEGTRVLLHSSSHVCFYTINREYTCTHSHIVYIHISVRTHIIITQVESSSCPNTDNFKLTEL